MEANENTRGHHHLRLLKGGRQGKTTSTPHRSTGSNRLKTLQNVVWPVVNDQAELDELKNEWVEAEATLSIAQAEYTQQLIKAWPTRFRPADPVTNPTKCVEYLELMLMLLKQ